MFIHKSLQRPRRKNPLRTRARNQPRRARAFAHASGKQNCAGFDFTDSRKANKKKDSEWVKVTMEGKDKMPAFKDKMTEADAQKMTTDIVRKFAAKN